MKCKYCDNLLSESELRLNDPWTGEQRGCNKCWSTVQEIIDEYSPSEIDEVLDELSVVSLEEVDYEHEPDELE